jgi:hypothetical protein
MAKIEWPQRGKRDETVVARRRILTSLCGRYRVVENTYKLRSVPPCCHALAMIGTDWQIISRHKKIGPAQVACAKHAREWGLMVTGE